MKYMKVLWCILAVGFLLVGLIFAAKMLCVIMAVLSPVVDAIIAWMFDHALVGGLTLAIGFVVFWFGEECEMAIRRERKERGR